MKHVRVTLKQRESPHQDDYGPIVMDLMVDDDDNVAQNSRVSLVFGAMGRRNTDSWWPFSMDGRGQVDFGSDSEVRNARLNILDRTIQVGELCTYGDYPADEDPLTYQITSVDPLR